MGDHNLLHSAAAYSDLHNMTSSAIAPDFHVFNTQHMSQYMESTPPFFSHNNIVEQDFSSGYLQDALIEFNSKRRRLKFSLDIDDHNTAIHHPNLYNSDYSMNLDENYDYLSQIMCKSDSISGDFLSRSNSEEEASIFSEAKWSNGENLEAALTTTTMTSSFNNGIVNPKSCCYENKDKETLHSTFPSSTSTAGNVEQKRKKNSLITKVVYPFAVVKPGGVEGDVTLNDINERILMPPTRPVRHPVGEFACRPLVSPDGPGLSGKEVVALTRIHTHGRGTITIIRTRN